MSAYHIIVAIEKEVAKLYPGQAATYELEIVLRSGRTVLCAPHKADTYMLKVEETVVDPTTERAIVRISYLAYEAIDQVTPIWL